MRSAELAARLRLHLLPAAALSYLAGAVLAGRIAPDAATLKLYFAAALLLFLPTFLLRQRPVALFCLCAAFALTGFVHTGFGLLPPAGPEHLHRLFPERAKATLTGTVIGMPEYDGRVTRFVLEADSVLLHHRLPGSTEARPTKGKIRLSLEAELPPDIHAGSHLLLMATVGRPFSARTPGVFDYRLYLAEQGIHVTGRISSPLAVIPFTDQEESPWQRLRHAPERLRQRLNDFLAGNLGPEQAALYQALLLGNKAGLAERIQEQFKATGCMHILSISGVHMSLLGLMLTWSFTWLLKRSSFLLLHTHVPTLAILLSLPPLIVYAFIAGMNTPVVRALLMALLFLIGVVLQRQRTLLPLIAAAALLILLVRPLALFTVSFQLSFSAVLALAVIYPRLLALLAPERPPRPAAKALRYLATAILVSVAATLGSLPFLLYHFNRFSLLGPFFNLLVEPLLCLWTLPCGLLALPLAFVAPDAAILLLKLGGLGITAADRITALGSALPLASLWTVTPSPLEILLYGLLLWSWVTRPMSRQNALRHAIAALLLLSFFTRGLWLHRTGNETEVTFLDVGQGSSTFIRLPTGATILLDGGSRTSPGFDPGERILAPFLWKNKVWRLDEVVVTHPDSDHYNGLPFVMDRFRPKQLWINGEDKDSWPYRSLLQSAAADGTQLYEPGADTTMLAEEDVRFRFIQGAAETSLEPTGQHLSKNDRSLVLKLTHGDIAFLFPGDLGHQGEDQLLRAGKNLAADVLLAGHHGSRGSSSAPFIAAVDPRVVVVSSGRSVRGHYFDQGHRQAWEESGRTVLATAELGSVTITTDGTNIFIK